MDARLTETASKSDATTTSTLHSGVSAAEECRSRGWTVGTLLVGDEGYGPTIIEITAIGQDSLLAVSLARNGKAVERYEGSWVLYCRDWQKYTDSLPEPYSAGTSVIVTNKKVGLDNESGVIIRGPDGTGFYTIELPDLGKWFVTDTFEVVA